MSLNAPAFGDRGIRYDVILILVGQVYRSDVWVGELEVLLRCARIHILDSLPA